MNRRFVVPLLVGIGACFSPRSIRVAALEHPQAGVITVATPVKAHLLDGSTAVFRDGIRLGRDSAWGVGMRYSLTLRDSTPLTLLALDSVVGMESYRTHTDHTLAYVTFGAVGAVGLAVAIACASDPKCFGSCPTFYSDSAGTPVLEAEGFSYSIAELFEARDVDRLRFPAANDGSLRLEVRNEAFETHFINHLELLEVRHTIDEVAVPDERNRPFVISRQQAPRRAVSRAGRDVRGVLAQAEGNVYRTPNTVLAAARAGDSDDWIDLTAAVPPGSDSVAIVFRLRNSLLNTILLYDIMLGDPGAQSLDWVGRDLRQVGPAVELAQWYQRHMGMDVSVRESGGWRVVAHLKDTGPVAWKDVAIAIPVLERDSVRVRLSFPADNWRIDRVAIAARFRRLPGGPVIHPLSAVIDAAHQGDSVALASMSGADTRYVEVGSGQFFQAVFQPGHAPSDSVRTFFLGSQGYYSEWVRNGWLRAPRTEQTFKPSTDALVEAIRRWQLTQDSLEARFMATRVPVR